MSAYLARSAAAPESGTQCGLTPLAVPFVLFSGGKGGVGKSTLAANVSVELSRAGRRVLLVDLDLGLGNLDVILRLPAQSSSEGWLVEDASLEGALTRGPCGLTVLPAGSGNPLLARHDARVRERLWSALAPLAPRYDVVVGDSPAGIGPDVLEFAVAASHVLAVTTPDPAALTDAYGLIKALDAHARRGGRDLPTPELVLNQTDGSDQARDLALKLQGVCERFLGRAPVLAAWFAKSAGIARATASQTPFVLESRQSLETTCMRRLAERLTRRFDLKQTPTRPRAAGPAKAFAQAL